MGRWGVVDSKEELKILLKLNFEATNVKATKKRKRSFPLKHLFISFMSDQQCCGVLSSLKRFDLSVHFWWIIDADGL